MRTVAMYNLLKRMNITSRIVVIYPRLNEDISQTMLEVYNPDTGTWAIEDPLFNIDWRFKGSNRHASTLDLMTYPIRETFIPCRSDTDCGYTPETENIAEYFASAQLIDLGASYNPALINPDRNKERIIQDIIPTERFYCDILVNGCSTDFIQIKSQPAPPI